MGDIRVDGKRIVFSTADPSGVVDWEGTIDADSLVLESRANGRRVELQYKCMADAVIPESETDA